VAQRATSWPAAASARATPALAGPRAGATVLASLPQALYLRCDDGSVLPVVTGSGLRLPSSLVLGSKGPTDGWGVRPGDHVVVGAAEVVLPTATVRVVRAWAPVRFPVNAGTGASLPVVAASASAPWRARALAVARAALRGDDVTGAVAGMVGSGQGLTPSGDDVLCGLLLGLRPEPRAVTAVWAAVAPRLGATTSLSASLLGESAEGYAVPAVVHLGAVLAGARVGPDSMAVLRRAVREVAGIGHSSGADLLAGLAGALSALAEPSAPRAHHSTGAVRPALAGAHA